MNMTIKTLVTYITSIGAAISVIAGGIFWLGDIIVTKSEFQTSIVEIRMHQVNESLARYHAKGVSSLGDSDKHKYKLLVKTAEILQEKRDALIGFTD